MTGTHLLRAPVRGRCIPILAVLLWAATATAEGRVTVYGLRLEPTGQDAKAFSRANWGGGINAVFPVPQLGNLVAGAIGFDATVLLSEKTVTQDALTLLRVEQQTSQDYARLYLGPEFGPHGHGFFRPHVGADVAIVFYGISTDVVVPDDYNRENEIRQSLRDERRVATGYDVNLGVDLNFMDKVVVDGGVKFIKSFNVPQQLGAGSVTIHPGYFQVYLGIGVPFGVFKRGPPESEATLAPRR
jgi:hypothetical protein